MDWGNSYLKGSILDFVNGYMKRHLFFMGISYIKNAPTGSVLTAVGKVVSDVRTIMPAVGEIYHEEQLLVRSQASYFVTGNFDKNDFPKAEGARG